MKRFNRLSKYSVSLSAETQLSQRKNWLQVKGLLSRVLETVREEKTNELLLELK